MSQTLQNELLSAEMLRSLADAKGPCITIVAPGGAGLRAQMDQSIQQVERGLAEHGSGKSERDLMHELRAVGSNLDPAEAPHGSLVILQAPGILHKFATTASLNQMVIVNDEFCLRAILPMVSSSLDFYLLALSQNKTRVLHCTEGHAEEVPLPVGTPDNFDDSRQTSQPDHVLDGRSSAGSSAGSMKGVLFGTSSDHEQKNEYILNFYNMLNRGVSALLKDTGAPLVVVAVDHELALYRSVNTYKNTIEPGVHGAPDGMKGGEMHHRALELVRSKPPQAVQRSLENFDKQVGTGHASSHARDIVKAAYEGRVSHLFYQASAEYKGNFNEMRRKITRHADGIEPMHDLLNEAIVQTIRHKGDAVVLQASHMPGGVPVCAIFRYPDPELQTTAS